jgi:hypothetical protein
MEALLPCLVVQVEAVPLVALFRFVVAQQVVLQVAW